MTIGDRDTNDSALRHRHHLTRAFERQDERRHEEAAITGNPLDPSVVDIVRRQRLVVPRMDQHEIAFACR